MPGRQQCSDHTTGLLPIGARDDRCGRLYLHLHPATIVVLDSARYDQATRADAPRQAPPVRVVPWRWERPRHGRAGRDTLHGTLQLMVLIRCGGHI